MENERLLELLDFYLGGELTPEEKRELTELLRRSEENRQLFWIAVRQHTLVEDLMREMKGAEGVVDKTPSTLGDTFLSFTDPIKLRRSNKRRDRTSVRLSARRGRLVIWQYLSIAAALLLVMGIWLVLNSNPPRHQHLAKRPPSKPVEPTSPEVSELPVLPPEPVAPISRQPLPIQKPSSKPPAPRSTADQRQVDAPQSLPSPALPRVPQPTPQGQVAESPKLKVQPQPEEPEPTPAAPETERPIARIAKIVGRVMYARGLKGPWIQAVEGVSLSAGDRLDTRTGMARLDVRGGTEVYANRSTLLRLLQVKMDAGEAKLVDLSRGEVYVAHEGDTKILVETSDGLFSPVGTRFNVHRRRSATIVTVEEGVVEARAMARGEKYRAAGKPATVVDLRSLGPGQAAVLITEGYQSRIRRGTSPSVPAKANLSRAVAWVLAIAGRRELLVEDFQDTQAAAKRWRTFTSGVRDETAVAEGVLRMRLENATARWANWYAVTRASFPVEGGLRVSARVRLREEAPSLSVAVSLYDERDSGQGDRVHVELLYTGGDGVLLRVLRYAEGGSKDGLNVVSLQVRKRNAWTLGRWVTVDFRVDPRRLAVRVGGKPIYAGPHKIADFRRIRLAFCGGLKKIRETRLVEFDSVRIEKRR